MYRNFRSVLFLGLYSSYCFLHGHVTCFNEVSLAQCTYNQLNCHIVLLIGWWIGAWGHGLVGYLLLVCLFLFLFLGIRCDVLSVDVQWWFISRQSICMENMLNVTNKYYSIKKETLLISARSVFMKLKHCRPTWWRTRTSVRQ